MSGLQARALELSTQGLTALRALRQLSREFPSAENLDLHQAVGLGYTGINPLWAQIGHPIHPVVCRHDPRR